MSSQPSEVVNTLCLSLLSTELDYQCPPGTTLRTDLPRRLCGIGISGTDCSSTILDTYGIEFRQVCGKIIGYQDQIPDALILVKESLSESMVTMLMV